MIEERFRYKNLLPYAILLLLSSPLLVGYAWLLIATFSRRTYGLTPEGLTIQNWRFLWSFDNWRDSVWGVTFNTLLLAISLAIVVVVLSALAGYALSRLDFTGRRSFMSLTLILHAFPSVTLLIAIYFVLRTLGLYNTLRGIILVKVALELPLGIWLMKGFFDGVPWDIERAAMVDGASRFRMWWEIVLPLIRPGIAALAIFSFISGWNEFLIPYTFTLDRQQATLAVYLNQLVGDTRLVDYGLVATIGLFQLLPVLLFFLFTQRYLLSIYAGGVKGGS
ncbi:MAG TPA: carbohydrate ABC transporter permease [Herpetosiphonaceae bacterium]|nr:carbohydrate ABC transporter permease [Herpetosiphonaceae bacterium]